MDSEFMVTEGATLTVGVMASGNLTDGLLTVSLYQGATRMTGKGCTVGERAKTEQDPTGGDAIENRG